MIKEALKYIVDLSAPHIHEINGETFADKEMRRVTEKPYAKSIHMSTLTSLIDYIQSETDHMSEKMIIHVVSPTEVRLYSDLDNNRKREEIAVVEASLPKFAFGKFHDSEPFVISLQSMFCATPDREQVMNFAGTVEDGTIASYSDDGISQKASVQTGLTNRETKIVPNPVKLAPYRTFHEVDQPVSNFVFRMRSSGGVECALFEADGGAWKNYAMKSIEEYLTEELEKADFPKSQFVVIS